LRGWLLMNSSSWRRTLKLVCTGCFRRKYADWTWYFHRSLLVRDTMSNCLMGCSLFAGSTILGADQWIATKGTTCCKINFYSHYSRRTTIDLFMKKRTLCFCIGIIYTCSSCLGNQMLH
jgi:hypothetical protein